MYKFMIGVLALLFSVNVLAWGQIGHRVTGAIAQQHLTAQAQAAISALLPNEDLAEASTYPDEMRSNPDEFWLKKAGPFHYDNPQRQNISTSRRARRRGRGHRIEKVY
ncbi:S1/P1 nuclease [Paraglaciecola sp. Hal342]